MEEADNLLNEEFIVLAKNIETIFNAKKERKAKFKVIYDEYLEDMKAFDDQAKSLKEEYEASCKLRVQKNENK